MVRDNVFLGQVKVPVPRAKADDMPVNLRYTYDINGLLEVEATVLKTGVKHNIVIEQNPGSMSREQIDKRLADLAKLKIHPREKAENRALLARAERLYEEALGSRRAAVGNALDQFNAVLNRQDDHEIVRVRGDFAAFLDSIEGESYL